jgi:hypothetical protein
MNRIGPRRLRGAFFLVTLLLGMAGVSAHRAHAQQPSTPGFLFLPFQNKSDFTGKWQIGTDVPRFLSAYIKERYRIPTVSSVVAQNFASEIGGAVDDVKTWTALYNRFGVRYLVAGDLDVFDVSRFMTGQPLLGGYEAYKGEVSISFIVYDLDRTSSSAVPVSITKGEASGQFADRSLALTLFGKPSERTVEFRELDKIRFGSEDFNRTVIGQACFQLAERFARSLETSMPAIKAWGMTNPDSVLHLGQSIDSISLKFQPKAVVGEVVLVEGESAFINLGNEDGLRMGQQILVYRDQVSMKSGTDSVGELRVTEFRGAHLTLTRIVNGQKSIHVKDKFSITVLR